MAASPEHLLAMKVLAARENRDVEDIRFLVGQIGLRSLDDVLRLVADVYPDERVSKRARLLLEDVLSLPPSGTATPAP
jgi:hypothetical protein